MRRSAFVLAAICLVAPGCKRVQRPASSSETTERAAMRASPQRDASPARPLKRCFVEDASGDPARPLDALLDRAAERYDHGDFNTSLICAEEAARVEPRSVEAHHDRAAALQELGRLDDAEAAFTRALALDPDDPETLAPPTSTSIACRRPTITPRRASSMRDADRAGSSARTRRAGPIPIARWWRGWRCSRVRRSTIWAAHARP